MASIFFSIRAHASALGACCAPEGAGCIESCNASRKRGIIFLVSFVLVFGPIPLELPGVARTASPPDGRIGNPSSTANRSPLDHWLPAAEDRRTTAA